MLNQLYIQKLYNSNTMTNITDHVVSLELAKKLKKLGMPQDTLFYWEEVNENDWQIVDHVFIVGDNNDMAIAAPLASELGERLPAWIETFKAGNLAGEKRGWYACVYNKDMDDGKEFSDPREANTRAQMLIYLIENNYFSFKDK